jgi:hypothetical protein
MKSELVFRKPLFYVIAATSPQPSSGRLSIVVVGRGYRRRCDRVE